MTPHRKLGLLGCLYLSQGLPFGFFTQSLPVMLREDGVSLAAIGSSSLLALPWGVKFLWAPYVDRFGSARWGRRRGWILPLQALLVLLVLALGGVDPQAGLFWLFVGVFCSNLLAATQDIATDGLAVELLPPAERGLGNGVQVAGFRVGMIIGGGLLLVVFDSLGRARSFALMALLLALCSVPIALHRERALPPAPEARATPGIASILRVLTRGDLRVFVPVLLLFKAGDAFGTAMLRPFLVDAGNSLADIGWLLGTVGAFAGLVGALIGGAWLARLDRRAALGGFCAVHGLSLSLFALHAWQPLPRLGLYAAIGVEHLLGGMATVALFTSMMDRAEVETAGTDYTVQASLVAGATGLFGLASGFSAEHLGYAAHFGLSTLLALVGAAVAFFLGARRVS